MSDTSRCFSHHHFWVVNFDGGSVTFYTAWPINPDARCIVLLFSSSFSIGKSRRWQYAFLHYMTDQSCLCDFAHFRCIALLFSSSFLIGKLRGWQRDFLHYKTDQSRCLCNLAHARCIALPFWSSFRVSKPRRYGKERSRSIKTNKAESWPLNAEKIDITQTLKTD